MADTTVLIGVPLEQFKALVGEAIREELKNHPTAIIQQPVEEQLLSRIETAQLLKISLGTLNQRVKSGDLPFRRCGRRILFLKSQIIDSLETLGKQ